MPRRLPSDKVIGIIGQALTDNNFQQQLFNNTDATISGLQPPLNRQDKADLTKVVGQMQGASFDELASVCRRYIALHGFIQS